MSNSNDVKKIDSVKILEIAAYGYPSFIKYLMFKCPNIENFSLIFFFGIWDRG